MAKVQKPLPGLARFLGIETQGVVRLDVPGTVQPVIEIEDYLGPNNWALASRTINPAAVGDENVITVPEHEFWRLKWASVKGIPPAASGSCIGLYLRRTINAASFDFSLNPAQHSRQSELITGAYTGFGVRLDKLNAEPGDQLVARIDTLTAIGAYNLDLYVQYQLVQI